MMINDPLIRLMYGSFVYGLWAMASFNNLIVSIFLYTSRNTTISNLLKIIFNFACLSRALVAAGFEMMPFKGIPQATCDSNRWLANLTQIAFRLTLSSFLLYRLRQIEHKRRDTIVGLTLFFFTALFQFIHMATYGTIKVVIDPKSKLENCQFTQNPISKWFQWTYIAFDWAIDLYVTYRLVRILQKANKNAKDCPANMRRPNKRSLFTAVMYWNFLRVFLALGYNIMSAYETATIDHQIAHYDPSVMRGFSSFIYICLSYVITTDAEIVRVIQGPKSNGGGGKGAVKGGNSTMGGKVSFGKSLQSTSSTDTKSYLEYTTSFDESKNRAINSASKEPHTQRLDSNTTVITSMKRASFFEWAKSVVGKRSSSENVNQKFQKKHDTEDSLEEIIRQEENEKNDPELGLVTESPFNDHEETPKRISSVSAVTANTDSTMNDIKSESIGNAI
ncbi:hypothetical protein G9A89_001657 [Geosiphon pyriformis]|nr:hypothetical protein G9A89_001657 [Geosiphon pyriformis]